MPDLIRHKTVRGEGKTSPPGGHISQRVHQHHGHYFYQPYKKFTGTIEINLPQYKETAEDIPPSQIETQPTEPQPIEAPPMESQTTGEGIQTPPLSSINRKPLLKRHVTQKILSTMR